MCALKRCLGWTAVTTAALAAAANAQLAPTRRHARAQPAQAPAKEACAPLRELIEDNSCSDSGMCAPPTRSQSIAKAPQGTVLALYARHVTEDVLA